MKSPFSFRPPRSAFYKLNARDKILAEWRGVDVNPAEKAMRSTAKSVGDIMPRITKDLRLEVRQGETEIIKVWNHLIDPTLTAHAQPTGIHKGTLFVNVDSSVWLDEIVRYRRKEILQRLQHSFGSDMIKRISFRVG